MAAAVSTMDPRNSATRMAGALRLADEWAITV
jgi:hypothetical protein